MTTEPISVASQHAPILDPNADKRLQSVTTGHVLKTANGDLAYTATVGYFDLVQENIDGEFAEEATVKARIFLTQYQAKVALQSGEINRRPVIFVFNGGPGSSSVWLHLGLFGPRIVQAVEADGTTPVRPPYKLIDNPNSPLAVADLVLIDPTSTGLSRVVPGEKSDIFHGVDEDIESIADLIRLWVTRNARWGSPLYIAGESYGVLRGSKLADRLAKRYGIYLNGLILISSPITGGPMSFAPGDILGAHAFLPSYAAVAWYHGKHPGLTLEEVIAEAEVFADNDYLWALNQGHRLSEEDRKRVVAKFASLTGLSPEYAERANLIVSKQRFYSELLRLEGKNVGEIDGRFTGWNADGNSETYDQDPVEQVITGAFASGINQLLRNELGYENDLSYEIITKRVRPWKAPKDPFRQGFTALAQLSAAIRTNRRLKVLYQLGYFDLCTPYWGAVSDVAKLQIPAELRDNVRISKFDSGHMIYIDEISRITEAEDIKRFVTETAGRPVTDAGSQSKQAPGTLDSPHAKPHAQTRGRLDE